MKKILVLFLFLLGSAAYAQDGTLKDMQSELKRNFNVLKKQNPPLYYLSYYIEDKNTVTIAASLGDVFLNNQSHKTSLNVDARVGSRQLDNTHELKGVYTQPDKLSTYAAPIEPNSSDALKNLLWRATDAEFKTAQDQFLKVKTNSAVKAKNEDMSDDFNAPIKQSSYYKPILAQSVDTVGMTAVLRELSAEAAKHPFILSSDIDFSHDTVNGYFVSSEGASIVEGRTYVSISYNLEVLNKDGMELSRNNSYHGRSVSDLPKKEVILADIKRDIAALKILQNAPVVEPFTGPAILKNRAAGVFFHEILGHRIEGHRQKSESFGQTFTKSVGKVIVSPILSVYDDPTLTHYNGTPLRGAYVYDSDGVKSERTTIIERGVLKNFLMGRSPVKGFDKSNGHGRKQLGYRSVSRMGNTIVEAQNTVPFETLKQMLRDEIKKQNKPYGLIIEDISGGFTMIDRSNPQSFKVTPLLVYKVYPDSRPDEVVRGVDIVGTPLLSFNKIIAAGNDPAVFNGSCGAESGWVPVSAVSPSILVSELEVEKVNKPADQPPLLPNPIKEGK